MAMQRFHTIKETHSKPITAICYNPMKHEIMAGCEGMHRQLYSLSTNNFTFHRSQKVK